MADEGALLTEPWIAAVLVGAAVLVAAAVGVWAWRRRRGTHARLRRHARGLLADFVIPDGDEGEIHVEYALLTSDGIVVLEFREVEGHVFGSNAMHDWTVLAEQRRYTFANPQPGLLDRVASVRRLVPGVPVEGYVVFSSGANFSKGRPDHVVMIDEFLAWLESRNAEELQSDLAAAWERLRVEAVAARVGGLMRD